MSTFTGETTGARGLWAWTERGLERAGDRLNPILVKRPARP